MTLETPKDNRLYAAIDLETTSLIPAASRIIEIAAIRFTEGGVLERFSSLVNPGVEIPKKVTEITGITDKDVKNAPPLSEVWSDVFKCLEETTLIAHNAPFDLGFLGEACTRLSLAPPKNLAFDSLQLCKAYYPEFKSYKLRDLSREFNLSLPNSHRALDDAEACRVIFLKCLERAKAQFDQVSDRTINELFSKQNGPLSIEDFLQEKENLAPDLKPILSAMNEGKSVWLLYGSKQKPRHVVPTYLYPSEKGPVLKGYALDSNQYKDFYCSKLKISTPPDGEPPSIRWAGPVN